MEAVKHIECIEQGIENQALGSAAKMHPVFVFISFLFFGIVFFFAVAWKTFVFLTRYANFQNWTVFVAFFLWFVDQVSILS